MSTNRAFTLIETLVAIAVVTLAIVGPFVAIQTALVASYSARDQLTASMLAQEAIEYVRSVRDGNYVYSVGNPATPYSWLRGLDGTAGPDCIDPNPNDATPNNCTVDMMTRTATRCGATGASTCPVLNQSATSYLYTHASGNPATKFTRSITLAQVSAGREMRVTATVTWMTGGRAFSVVISEVLSAWL